MRRPIKILVIISIVIIVILVLAIAFISPITKYLVEKYDEKYTGRQITMSMAYVNPFSGYMLFKNFKIYELKSDSLFFSAKSVSLNFEIFKLLSKNYELSEITLNSPHGIVILKKNKTNFDDLIKRFFSKKDSKITRAPIHLNILGIKIIDGEFHYREELVPVNYFIKKVNIESTGLRWDSDTIAAKFSFFSGIGNGDMIGNFTINTKKLDYRLAVIAHKFDANILVQYLKDLTNYGSFGANIDADLNAKGNFTDAENITASGLLAINDFHVGKNINDDYAAFDKLTFAIYELSPKNKKYLFDSVSLNHPYFKYERYDYLDNLEYMFGKKGAQIVSSHINTSKFNLLIEIANYIKILSKNFFRSNYHVNHVAIYNGDFKFNDFSLFEEFSVELDPLYVYADSINKGNKRINVVFKSGIKPYGNTSIALSINPKDSSDFDLHYQLQKLPASMFNPYTITYTSFPMDRGTFEFNGTWHVRNGIIQSDNHMVIIDPRVSRRLRNKDLKWIPMPLVMSFVRERGNVIDYKIPISGNLKNPKFHLRDVLLDLLINIFVKPPTTPYGIQVKNVETEIEKSLTMKWEHRQSELRPNQGKFIEKIAKFLANNPEASIVVHPQQYERKEKEYILFFEAKKKYYLLTNKKTARAFTEEDSVKVDRMNVKDTMFVHYLNRHVKDPLIFTTQEKCSRLIGSGNINADFERLNKDRRKVFIQYFKERNVEKQVKISSGSDVIPYNGFSFYKIEYKGELPKALSRAYRKMNDLNNEAPRKKFKEDRKDNKNSSP